MSFLAFLICYNLANKVRVLKKFFLLSLIAYSSHFTEESRQLNKHGMFNYFYWYTSVRSALNVLF